MPAEGSVVMGVYNFTKSIEAFARASLNYGLQPDHPVKLSTKNTVLNAYANAFKDIVAHQLEDVVIRTVDGLDEPRTSRCSSAATSPTSPPRSPRHRRRETQGRPQGSATSSTRSGPPV